MRGRSLFHLRSLLRAGAFAALAAALLAGLQTGWLTTLPEPEPQRWAPLYRRAGDAYLRLLYLAGVTEEAPLARRLLHHALRYYRLSLEQDPFDIESAVSLGLTLYALQRDDEAKTIVGRTVLKVRPGEQRRALAAALSALSSPPQPGDVEKARRLILGLAPGPLALAGIYAKLGRADLAEKELSAAGARALRVVPGLAAMVAACGLLMLAGLVGAAVAVVQGRRWRLSPSQPAAWSLRAALEALVLWVALAIASSSALMRVWPPGGELDSLLMLAPSVIAGGGAIAWVWVVAGRGARFGWSPRSAGRSVGWGLAAAGLLAPMALSLESLLQRFLGPLRHPLVPTFASAPEMGFRAALVFAACVIMPALEETLFRGILYRALRRSWSAAPAAIASAMVFALGHLSWVGFLPYLLVGLMLALMYEKTGSLLAPAITHGAFNAFNLAILLVLFG